MDRLTYASLLLDSLERSQKILTEVKSVSFINFSERLSEIYAQQDYNEVEYDFFLIDLYDSESNLLDTVDSFEHGHAYGSVIYDGVTNVLEQDQINRIIKILFDDFIHEYCDEEIIENYNIDKTFEIFVDENRDIYEWLCTAILEGFVLHNISQVVNTFNEASKNLSEGVFKINPQVIYDTFKVSDYYESSKCW